MIRLRYFGFLLLAIGTPACFARSISAPMRSAATPSVTPPAGMARILFVRPFRSYGWAVNLHIADGDRAFLGDSINNSVFAADLTPGAHDLCVGAGLNGGPLLQGSLAAGKTYVVRVDMSMGGPRLTPMRPGTADHKDLMAQLPEIRGSELAGPHPEDGLDPGDLKFLFGKCADAIKGTSSDENAALVLKDTDAQ